jgi:hypothetical protein
MNCKMSMSYMQCNKLCLSAVSFEQMDNIITLYSCLLLNTSCKYLPDHYREAAIYPPPLHSRQ